ncbi:Transient receptor potential cation channel subfamily V member 6 [Aphelenchoides besseyi]|nr:Transient receptor potential cation channel subfamily V member 6 [Aphelenchoides besseyi]
MQTRDQPRKSFQNARDKSGSNPVANIDKHYAIYNLVDMHGGGELIPWMRYALNSGDYSLIDGYMETKVRSMMYNGGKGKLESVAELVKRRNKERNERLGAFSRKKGKGKSGPNILDDFNQEVNRGDLKKALKLLDGGKGGKGDAKYREVVWKLDERGQMGENLVGCCLMLGGAMHNKLAMRMLEQYPKLINDIFTSEDYYGLSPLHQAIVNEDPRMVNYLLQNGADINQRCYGAHFCPDDQVSSRTDSLEHEYVEVALNTNYSGKMYFGEYPLAFAACTNQEDCYRILLAKKADPNAQDTNGNTVLHMTVIHENLDMFRLAYETGARLQVMNKQNLTPLTLAAKLAKKRMFEQILKLESDVIWQYGDAASTAFPLAKLDTINQETGELNEDSGLSLIVYGESNEHLDLLDGLVEELLQAKWKAFGRQRLWIVSFSAFSFYYVCFFMAFMCRPFSISPSLIPTETMLANGGTFNPAVNPNGTYVGYYTTSLGSVFETVGLPDAVSRYFTINKRECPLWNYANFGYQGYIRMISELLVVTMVLFQLVSEVLDIRSIGKKRWWQVLRSFPAKVLYKISLLIVLCIVPIRLGCGINGFVTVDNTLSLIAVLMTTLHFLYYCRAIKFVGPFVLMVYMIITRDIIRFFMIYLIFVMGFSQGFYLIFLACERVDNAEYYRISEFYHDVLKKRENIMANPVESMLRLFISTIGEFTVMYRELNGCSVKEMVVLGKVLFVIFEMFVSLMQFNLLIAMMTRTYELIYRTQKEWKRQWAQVILMLELSLQPKDRLMALLKYSRPIGTDKRKRAFVVSRKIDALTETERIIKEQQESEKIKEKKQVLKRRLRDYQRDASKHGAVLLEMAVNGGTANEQVLIRTTTLSAQFFRRLAPRRMGSVESRMKNGDAPKDPKVGLTQPAGSNDKHYAIYNLVDMHGGGELIPWMRYALNSGDYSLIDGYMETKVRSMMYNGGKGKLESVAELVKRRNKERNERLGAFSRKKGKGKSGPNILDDFNQEANQGDLKKALKLLDGGKGGKGDAKYREVIWKLEERGSMGENLVGCCLMQGGVMHNKLAIRMFEQYPKLINDIFISEDYYGLSPLHQAIVNEEPWMVNYLLQNGADINQRCYGAHFCPDDQVSSRTDSLEHEYVEVALNTNYSGKMYFGEYPLAFAACTNQEDCYRILRAKKADPNAQDTNGNTVLHMTVIHENLSKGQITKLTQTMFQLAYATGARLQIMNKQNLTPLTLAAKLAKRRETNEHLDLLDGLLEELLQAKWKAFGKKRWIYSFSAFAFYYIVFFSAFMCRPFTSTTTVITNGRITPHGKVLNDTEYNEFQQTAISVPANLSYFAQVTNKYWFESTTCHLWDYSHSGGGPIHQGKMRFVCESMVLLMVFIQLAIEIRDIHNIGKRRWWQVLKSFPAKILYKVSLLLTLSILPIRCMCISETLLLLDNMFSLLATIMTTIHFLFYCRAVKFVGPFVLMVYTIITRDMIRFFLIYFIFLMGFSQGFYIIFLACEPKYDQFPVQNHTNILANPVESMVRLFITTIGEFTVFYRELNGCEATDMATLGKILFVTFEMFVSLMQFNLLIAMMTRTYELIYRTQKEWKRQWAQVILMLELSLQPKDRLMALLKYSRPIGIDKRRRAFVLSRKIDTFTETERFLKEQQESEKIKEKKLLLKRRLRDLHKDGTKVHSNTLRPTTSAAYLAPTPGLHQNAYL